MTTPTTNPPTPLVRAGLAHVVHVLARLQRSAAGDWATQMRLARIATSAARACHGVEERPR